MTNNLGKFAATAVVLYMAHDVADHLGQTDHQAAGKTTSWRAMAGHVGTHSVVQTVSLALSGLRYRPTRFLAAMALSAASHGFIDRRWPVRWLQTHTGSEKFADMQTPINGPYVADQALHHLFVIITARVLTSGK